MRSIDTQLAELLSVDSVSRRLACSRGTVYRLIASGELPAVRLGGAGASLRIDERELDQWLRERHIQRTPEDNHG
jgi:excisionase family DNA binding protein